MNVAPWLPSAAPSLPLMSPVVLDGCAFATMLSILYPLVTQGFANTHKRSFAFACIAHVAATALALIHNLASEAQVAGADTILSGLVASTILDVVSLAFLVAALVRHYKTSDRQKVSHTIACGMVLAVLPSALAVVTFPQHGSLAIVRFAYALSLTMFFSAFTMVRDFELTRREADVALRQTHALADQMRPHFIFNALSTIQGLCYADPEAAAMQVEQFSNYLRGHIDALAENGLVPFEVEVGHAREYAALSRAGSSTPFQLTWDLRETAFLVPSLTIQPLVENAIRYGALARSDGQGNVTVVSERKGAFARVVISDNGPGMDAQGKRGSNRLGIGLASAKERLQVLCDGSLTVSSDGQGTKVVVVVPLDVDARCDKTSRKGGALL